MKKLILFAGLLSGYIFAADHGNHISSRLNNAVQHLQQEAITDPEKRYFLAGMMVFSRLAEVCQNNPPTHAGKIEGCRKIIAAHEEISADFIQYMLGLEELEKGTI